jgi:starch synthase
MKILLATSEVHPFSKTGGLADMVGALGKHLALAGHTVGLVTPLYRGIREKHPQLHRFEIQLDLALGRDRVLGEIWTLEPVPGLTIFFVDQPDFYQRAGLYQKDGVDYPDNAERFIFLSKATVQLARHWNPELIHAHDWQVGMVPLMVHHEKQRAGWGAPPRTCITIHNLAYQGVFPASQYALSNLPWDYFHPDCAEFYGQLNCLKSGIATADLITTVSPRYAREITTTEYGCGLEGLLLQRQDQMQGILNGVDYQEWNTNQNPFIACPYSAEDLEGKARNKAALQAEFKLPINDRVPVFGSVNRLVEQKGVDIQLGALEEMLTSDMQFVLLGSGHAEFETAYRKLAERHPEKVAVHIGYNHALSHRIEAGCDFFLLPSRFEPCGLNQMYSLRYGTIPIVRATGGLDDTVIDFAEDPDRANGIKFTEYSSTVLAKCLRKAMAIYAEPEWLNHYRLNGMAPDFSWERTALQYAALYAQP